MLAPAHEVQTSSARGDLFRRVLPATGLVVLLGAGSWWTAQSVQSGLQDEAALRLSEAGIDASVTYDGRRAKVEAEDPTDAVAAADLLRGWNGTASVAVDGPQGSTVEPGATPPTSQAPSPTSGSATATADPSSSPEPSSPSAEPSSAPTEPGRKGSRKVRLARVLFPANGAVLDPGDKADLDRVARYAARHRKGRILVFGNADNQGPESWGWYMSQLRASAVGDYLRYRGVPADHLVVRWFADRRPTAPNDSDEGRQANRRVDVSYDPQG